MSVSLVGNDNLHADAPRGAKGRKERGGQRRKPSSEAPSPADLRKIIIGIVEAMALVFRVYGFRDQSWDRAGTIEWHLKCVTALGGSWLKFYKYKLAAFYAASEGQTLPPNPLEAVGLGADRADTLLGGKPGRWFKSMKKRDPKMFQSLAYSLLMSKRGMQRPGKRELAEAEYEAFVKLTTTVPEHQPVQTVAWGDVETLEKAKVETELSRQNLETEIRRTVRELYSGKEYTLEDRYKPHMPSTSANYTKSRSKGGMVGEMLEHPDLWAGLPFSDHELVAVRNEGDKGWIIDDSNLKLVYAEVLRRAQEKAIAEGREAEFLALPEALKMRVITKGPAFRNFVLKSLQRFLWAGVRMNPAGRLVGQTIDEEYLCRQVGRLRPGEEYTSVDYKDATNEIASWASEVAVEEISSVLNLEKFERDMLKQNLTGHRFENPRQKGDWREQVRGQLMGSISSFPILCIINLAICRWAQELDRGRRLSLATAAICVNGDDAVLRGKSSYRHWSAIAPIAGLSESVGKVYRSGRFLNMNSTLFKVLSPEEEVVVPESTRLETSTAVKQNGEVEVSIKTVSQKGFTRFLERVKYVNIGLIYGLKRSEVKTSVSEVGLPESLGKVASWLVESSPEYTREEVIKSFLNKRWKELSKTSLSWFLPENLGGLGIPRPKGPLGQNSLKTDMRYAAAVYYRIRERGQAVPRRPADKEWLTWDKVSQREKLLVAAGLPTKTVIGSAHDAAQNRFHGSLAIEVFLRARELREIFSSSTSASFKRAQKKRHNKYLKALEKYRTATMKLLGKVQPFEHGKLPSGYEDEIIVDARFVDEQQTPFGPAPDDLPDWGDTPPQLDFDYAWD